MAWLKTNIQINKQNNEPNQNSGGGGGERDSQLFKN